MEKKLMVVTGSIPTFDTHDATGKVIHKPFSWLHEATPADIAEAHPRCKDCRHCKDPRVTWMDPYDRTCYNQASPSFLKTVHMLDDYCRHWEAKE